MGNQKKPFQKNQDKVKQYNSYLKYSGLAFQMLLIIGIPVAVGVLIDQNTSYRFPLFTIIFVLISLSGVIYWLIKSTTRMDWLYENTFYNILQETLPSNIPNHSFGFIGRFYFSCRSITCWISHSFRILFYNNPISTFYTFKSRWKIRSSVYQVFYDDNNVKTFPVPGVYHYSDLPGKGTC